MTDRAIECPVCGAAGAAVFDSTFRQSALALEADRVMRVLDDWAAGHAGMRSWRMVPHPAGCVECVLRDEQHDADGTDRAKYHPANSSRVAASPCWEARFANINAMPGRASTDARARAAAAIEQGQVPR